MTGGKGKEGVVVASSLGRLRAGSSTGSGRTEAVPTRAFLQRAGRDIPTGSQAEEDVDRCSLLAANVSSFRVNVFSFRPDVFTFGPEVSTFRANVSSLRPNVFSRG